MQYEFLIIVDKIYSQVSNSKEMCISEYRFYALSDLSEIIIRKNNFRFIFNKVDKQQSKLFLSNGEKVFFCVT